MYSSGVVESEGGGNVTTLLLRGSHSGWPDVTGIVADHITNQTFINIINHYNSIRFFINGVIDSYCNYELNGMQLGTDRGGRLWLAARRLHAPHHHFYGIVFDCVYLIYILYSIIFTKIYYNTYKWQIDFLQVFFYKFYHQSFNWWS